MHYLRQIIFVISFFLVSSLEAISEWEVAFQVQNLKGHLQVSDPKAESKLFTTSQTLRLLQEGSFFYPLSFEWVLISRQNDYSQLYLTDATGKIYPLSQTLSYRQEWSLNMGTTVYFPTQTQASINLSSSIGATPFPQQALAFQISHPFPSALSRIQLQWLIWKRRQPLSYFQDIDFKLKPRPTLLTGQEIALQWEYPLSNSVKVAWLGGWGNRPADRPPYWRAHLKGALALLDTLFVRLEWSSLWEDTRYALKNERGYFNQNYLRAMVSWEWAFDYLFSLSYTLGIEHEKDPRLGRHIQVASDQYLFSLEYEGKNLKPRLEIGYQITNHGVKVWNIIGALSWFL